MGEKKTFGVFLSDHSYQCTPTRNARRSKGLQRSATLACRALSCGLAVMPISPPVCLSVSWTLAEECELYTNGGCVNSSRSRGRKIRGVAQVTENQSGFQREWKETGCRNARTHTHIHTRSSISSAWLVGYRVKYWRQILTHNSYFSSSSLRSK